MRCPFCSQDDMVYLRPKGLTGNGAEAVLGEAHTTRNQNGSTRDFPVYRWSGRAPRKRPMALAQKLIDRCGKLPHHQAFRGTETSMTHLLDELSLQAQTLPLEQRAELAQILLESVARETDPQVQAAWESEVASRIARYERGEAKLIPASEVFEAARLLTQ